VDVPIVGAADDEASRLGHNLLLQFGRATP
jgi:hypothetical protein